MRLKIDKREILVYAALVLVNVYYGLNETTLYLENTDYMILGAIALFGIHVFMYEHLNRQELIVFSVLLIVFIINYIQRGDSRILVLLITVIAVRNMELRDVLNVFFHVRLILFILVVILNLWGSSESVVKISNRGTRYALGFSHPNQFMFVVCMLIMLYVCLYYERINGVSLLLLTIVLMIGYLITKSNTGLITGMIMVILLVLYKYFKMSRLLEILGKYLAFFLMFLSVFLPYTLRASVDDILFFRSFPQFTAWYENALAYLDSALSNRLTLSRKAFIHTDIGLLTTRLNTTLSGYSIVDSGYMQLLLVYGLLGTALFLLLNWFMVRKLIVRKQYIYIWAFIGMSLYAFTENIFCSLAYNFTLVFIAYLFQKDNTKRRHLVLGRGATNHHDGYTEMHFKNI